MNTDFLIGLGLIALVIAVALHSTWAGRASTVLWNFQVTRRDDTELSSAARRAQDDLAEFLNAVACPSGRGGFGFKYGVPVRGGKHECMWFDHVQFVDGHLRGRLANVPECADLKYGDWLSVPPQGIIDWKFVEGGRLRGGYTIRVFRDRMTPAQRARFDAELGVRID